jgi:hypothetical protein
MTPAWLRGKNIRENDMTEKQKNMLIEVLKLFRKGISLLQQIVNQSIHDDNRR